MLDGFQDVVDGGLWCVFRLRARLEDARPHENGIPMLVRLLVVVVRATDVGLGRVAHEVDCLWRGVDVVCFLAPLLQESEAECVSACTPGSEHGRIMATHRVAYENVPICGFPYAVVLSFFPVMASNMASTLLRSAPMPMRVCA